jgi:hypothetical protein
MRFGDVYLSGFETYIRKLCICMLSSILPGGVPTENLDAKLEAILQPRTDDPGLRALVMRISQR